MNRNATAGCPDAPGRQRLKKKGTAFLLSLFLSAFLLNFFWESAHGLLFAGHQEMSAERYVPMMVQMALIDALSLTAFYLLTALVARSFFWFPRGRNLILFIFLCLFGAWATEYGFVHLLHTWAYTTAMPLVFGVGLSPLLQPACTGLPAVLTARGLTGFFNEQP